VITETLVVTVDAEGRPNIAPQGLVLEPSPDAPSGVVFRPWRNTATFRNLEATRAAVVHLTDDILLLARAAIDLPVAPPLVPATRVRGLRLEGAPLAHEVEIVEADTAGERATLRGRVVATVAGRPWQGLNRARHAVLEAAILATRVHLTGAPPVLAEYAKLAVAVEKTGGDPEREAMRLLEAHVRARGELS
jgi:hypothetical protein